MLLVYITRFKTDLRDNSVSISNYNVKSMNADYDGKLVAVAKVL